MNKLLALATAGALAFGMVAATAVPSQAAQFNWKGGGQSQQWKKSQGGQKFQKFSGKNWNAPKNLGKKWDGPKKYGNLQGPKSFGNVKQKNWNAPKHYGNNWKPPHYPKQPQFKKKFVKQKHYPKQHYKNNFNPAPFIFGFALGTIVSNAYAYDFAGLSPHQLWCLEAYPNTYNPATNLFYIRPGVVAVCVSPYSGGPVGYLPY